MAVPCSAMWLAAQRRVPALDAMRACCPRPPPSNSPLHPTLHPPLCRWRTCGATAPSCCHQAAPNRGSRWQSWWSWHTRPWMRCMQPRTMQRRQGWGRQERRRRRLGRGRQPRRQGRGRQQRRRRQGRGRRQQRRRQRRVRGHQQRWRQLRRRRQGRGRQQRRRQRRRRRQQQGQQGGQHQLRVPACLSWHSHPLVLGRVAPAAAPAAQPTPPAAAPPATAAAAPWGCPGGPRCMLTGTNGGGSRVTTGR